MTWVTPKVEIAFTTNPLAAPVWEDVTADVETIDIKRGRSSELGTFSAGSCNVVLRNDARQYDPDHLSGPHAFWLVPKRKMRVTANLGAGDVALFTGYVSGFPLTIDYVAERMYCELEATDAFEFFSAQPMPTSSHTVQMMALGATAYYPLTDDLTADGYVQNLSDPAKAGSATGLAWNDYPLDYPVGVDRVPSFGTVGRVVMPGNGQLYKSTAGCMVSFWMQESTTAPEIRKIVSLAQSGYTAFGAARIYIQSSASGTSPNCLVWQMGNTVPILYSPAPVTDGLWHHYLLTFYPGPGQIMEMVIDGVVVANYSAAGTYGHDPNYATTDAYNVLGDRRLPFGYAPISGSLHSVALFDHYEPVGPPRQLYESAFGWPVELAHIRMQRLLAASGWPAADTLAPNSASQVQPTPDLSGSLLENLQQVSAAEVGSLFMKADGDVNFYGRHTIARDPALRGTKATFGDGPGELRYLEGNPSQDITNIHNVVIVQRRNGVEQVSEDAQSISLFWRRGEGIRKSGLLLTNDVEAKAYADFLLARYRFPMTRVEDVTLDGRTDALVLAQIVGRELQDLVVFKRKPNNVGLQTTYSGVIDSITHKINLSQRTWVTTFNLAPAITTANFFQFDDADRGHLGRYPMGF